MNDSDDPPGTRYKVWVIVEREDGKTGENEELAAPMSGPLRTFHTFDEANAYAEMVETLFGGGPEQENDDEKF